MKAIVFYQHGGPEVLKYEDAPDPAVGPGQVLVEVKAAALNRLDIFVRQGWPGLELAMPHIPGADAAGVVLKVGEGVDHIAPGDRVAVNPTTSCGRCKFCLRGEDNLCVRHSILGEFEPGTYAQQVLVPALNVLKLPDHISHQEAAAFSLVGITAWQMLITKGQLQAGEDVLIIGAGGGVNTAAIQIAKFAKQISILGSTMGARDDYAAVMGQLFDGRLQAVIGQEMPLADGRQAQELLEAGTVYGKIVLTSSG